MSLTQDEKQFKGRCAVVLRLSLFITEEADSYYLATLLFCSEGAHTSIVSNCEITGCITSASVPVNQKDLENDIILFRYGICCKSKSIKNT